jgi:hypothetical protein
VEHHRDKQHARVTNHCPTMSEQPQLAISLQKTDVPVFQPNLMPFNISFSGPAPVSTYFQVYEIDASTSLNTKANGAAKSDTRREFTATFRGRSMCGLEVDVPEGYVGIVMKSENAEDAGKSNGKKAVAKAKTTKGKGKASAKSKGRATRSQSALLEEPEEEPMQIEDDYAMLSRVEQDSAATTQETGSADATRLLEQTGTFEKFVLWNADVHVDEGRDEYLRSMDEWVRLANVVCRCFHRSDLDDDLTFSLRFMLDTSTKCQC